MQGRFWGGYPNYRYGLNGKENDDEAKGYGNQVNFDNRGYDTRVGRWLSLDAVRKPWMSPYAFAGNNPVNNVDPDGKDDIHFHFYTTSILGADGRITGGPTTAIIEIVKNNSPDRFFHHTHNTEVRLPTNYSRGGMSTFEKTVEFYPWNPDSRSGLTKSDLLGIIPINDRDYATLIKYASASPSLKSYIKQRSQGYEASSYDKENYKGLLDDLPVYNTIRKVEQIALMTATVISVAETGIGLSKVGVPPRLPSGFGDLTVGEVREIQNVVNEAGRPLEVGGSVANGTRRGVGTNLPIGKGPGTKSDIDYIIPNSSLPYFKPFEFKLPDINKSPGGGIINGVGNPYIGPLIRFEPNATKPTLIPAIHD